MIFSRNFKIDFQLLGILLLFSFLSSFIVFSASKNNIEVLVSHEIKVFISFVAFLFFSFLSPILIKIWIPRVYAVSIIMLVATLLFGETNMGAKRWLDLFVFNIQVSEFVKFILPLFVAWYIQRFSLVEDLKSLIFLSLAIFVPFVLTALQPDLGTSILILAAGLVAMFLGGLSYKIILFSFLSLVSLFPLFWFFLKDYQRDRIISFLNQEGDPLGSGYHVIQSKIAIGDGGVFGTGFGNGTQVHFGFIPEMHTDFIFAVIGEEFGFIGFLLLMFLYILLFYKLINMGMRMKNLAHKVFTFTFVFLLTSYLFINISMVVGLLPVVGVPLPLVSFGGSYLLAIFISLGIISSFYNYELSSLEN